MRDLLFGKVELNRLELALCIVASMALTTLATRRLQPRLFAEQVARGNFGWAEFLAGGTLSEHDRLWPSTRA